MTFEKQNALSESERSQVTDSETSQFKAGTIALVGETNVGKSTLLNAILGAKVSIVSPRPHTTRNRILGIKSAKHYQLVFVDTPGFAERRKGGEMGKFTSRVLQQAAAEVDLLVFIVSAPRLVEDISRIKTAAQGLREQGLKPAGLVLINKVDLVQKPLLLPVLSALQQEFPQAELVPISAAKGISLDLLERLIVERLPESEGPLFSPDLSTDQSEYFWAGEIVREKLFNHLRAEIPYGLAVVIEQWEETDEIAKIYGNIFVERESQKAMVIGKAGSLLGQIGKEAREELEAELGKKVFLKLFVKVEPQWTKTEKGLEKLGYTRSENA